MKKQRKILIAALAAGFVISGAVLGSRFLTAETIHPDEIVDINPEWVRTTPLTEEQRVVLRQEYVKKMIEEELNKLNKYEFETEEKKNECREMLLEYREMLLKQITGST